MSKGRGPLADRLRKMGFVPLPRLWVKERELQVIKDFARKHGPEINKVRRKMSKENRNANKKRR